MTNDLLPEAINRQHNATLQLVNDYLDALIQHSGHHNERVATEIVFYAKQLLELTPEESRPEWLLTLVREFSSANLAARQTTTKATEFTRFMLLNYGKMQSSILLGDELLYDIDATYATVRDEENIPETFDALVAQLEHIIALDVIESRTVEEAINRLKALFQINKRGSLASIFATMHFGRYFLNAFAGSFSTVPQIKPFVDEFKKEFAIAEERVKRATDKMEKETAKRFTNMDRLNLYLQQAGIDKNQIAGYLPEPNTSEQTS